MKKLGFVPMLFLLISVAVAAPRRANPKYHPLEARVAQASTVCGTSPHCVTLTWTASTDGAANPTLGYDVYKGTTPGGESTTPLNGTTLVAVGCSTTATCTYIDTSVTVGQTIYYTVQASLNGVNSISSDEATAKIPPAPPSGVTITAQ